MSVGSNDRCGGTVSTVDTTCIFHKMLSTCQPITTKSRKFNRKDKFFYQKRGEKNAKRTNHYLLNFSFRLGASSARCERWTPRMVIDYSQTVNRYTYLIRRLPTT